MPYEQKNYTCLADAAHDRIGVLMGSAEDGFITQKYPDADILRIDMSTDLLAALMVGSCDVAILSSVETREILIVNSKLKKQRRQKSASKAFYLLLYFKRLCQ